MLFRNAGNKKRVESGAAPRGLSFGRLFLFLALTVYPAAFLHAETRVKTVEYNFGGYYGVDVLSAVQTNFPTRTIKLPENGKAIKSAWLEFEGLAVTSNQNVTALALYFDAAATATTAVPTTGQYTDQTGESMRLFARADVTAGSFNWMNSWLSLTATTVL
mgnify:CR=1 FL=1